METIFQSKSPNNSQITVICHSSPDSGTQVIFSLLVDYFINNVNFTLYKYNYEDDYIKIYKGEELIKEFTEGNRDILFSSVKLIIQNLI